MEHGFDTRPRPWLDLIGNDSKSTGTPETSAERDLNAVVEPHVGMEFESEDAAEEFYEDYSRRVGFIMRRDQCGRSDVDKRVLSRRLSCNKQGRRSVKARYQVLSVRRPRPTTREYCKAKMLVKLDKSGKWVVTRVVKDHAHPLIVSSGNSLINIRRTQKILYSRNVRSHKNLVNRMPFRQIVALDSHCARPRPYCCRS